MKTKTLRILMVTWKSIFILLSMPKKMRMTLMILMTWVLES